MFFFLDNAFWNGGGCSFPKFKFSGRRGEEQKKVGGGGGGGGGFRQIPSRRISCFIE